MSWHGCTVNIDARNPQTAAKKEGQPADVQGARVLCDCVYVIIPQIGHQPDAVPKPACGQLSKVNIFSLSPSAPKRSFPRDRFCYPVLRKPDHSQHPGCIWCFLARLHSPFPPSATVLIRTVTSHRSSTEPINSVPMSFITERPPAHDQKPLR